MDHNDKSHRLDYFYEQLGSAVYEDFRRNFPTEKIDQLAFSIAYGLSLLAKSVQGLADEISHMKDVE